MQSDPLAEWPRPVQKAASWNTTVDERHAWYPCDAYLTPPWRGVFRAIDIGAPASVTFQWLTQLRLAPYSYDWLDNGGRRSPRRLVAQASPIREGDRFLVFTAAEVHEGRHISGVITPGSARLYGPLAVTYAVSPRPFGRSRLVVKLNLGGQATLARWRANALVVGDLVMMRKQLLTLRDLAQATLRT